MNAIQIYWLPIFIFGSLGLVVFTKFMLLPYLRRVSMLWAMRRRMKRLKKGKPPELQNDLQKIIDGLQCLIKNEKI